MTDYYVRKTGSNGNDGTNPDTEAWLTIDFAASTIVAGDTVYVGAGVYRELITMDTSGNSGQQITFIADVSGEMTGDGGLVIISAYNTETTTVTRAYCLNPNGKTFITWRGFCMIGGSSGTVYNASASNYNYEGCVFEDCVFVSGSDWYENVLWIDFNYAATPTGDGIAFRRCVFDGGSVIFRVDGGEVDERNLKARFDSCYFNVPWANNLYAFHIDDVTAGTYKTGGVDFANCTFLPCYTAVQSENGVSTTYPINVRNCYIWGFEGLDNNAGAGGITYGWCTFMCSSAAVGCTSVGGNKTYSNESPQLWGGFGDWPLTRFWGWSPYKFFEPMQSSDIGLYNPSIGTADPTSAPAYDIYNNPRPMHSAPGTATYYFDGSDVAASDPDAAWTDETNFDDGSTATSATTATTGDVDNNYIMVEGTDTPATVYGIAQVQVRIHTLAASDLAFQVRTNGWDENIGSNVHADLNGWSGYTTLSTPTGGWTAAKIQALEIRVWCTDNPDGVSTTRAEILVTSEVVNDDRGMVESRSRPHRETTIVRTGDNSIRITGPGPLEILLPVDATSTIVSVYGRYDSDYTGTLPQLVVTDIPGQTERTDIITGAADQWEQLSVSFTPTSKGIARIRLINNATNFGQCFFDDLDVA